VGIEVALIESRIRRLLLEPGLEVGGASRDAVVCSLVDHADDDARPRLTKN